MERLKPKFKIGDEVFVQSRYNGIVCRTVRSVKRVRATKDEPAYYAYELNRLVQIHKDGHCVGRDKSKQLCGCCVPELTGYTKKERLKFIEEMQNSPYPYNIWAHPCHEVYLFQVGDFIYNSHPILGGITDVVFTEEMAEIARKNK
jgi:hypothetical protein